MKLGKMSGHKIPVESDGKVIAYIVKHRAMESASYRMVGDPKQHHCASVKVALERIKRKYNG